jgi:hypothetical protein
MIIRTQFHGREYAARKFSEQGVVRKFVGCLTSRFLLAKITSSGFCGQFHTYVSMVYNIAYTRGESALN